MLNSPDFPTTPKSRTSRTIGRLQQCRAIVVRSLGAARYQLENNLRQYHCLAQKKR